MGMGWTISGLSSITRSGKTMYYDGKTQGIGMNNNDTFFLDGIRLIEINKTEDCIIYETEQGNIKVKGIISGETMVSFEVYYPDGKKGVFTYPSYPQNYISYPIISLKDLQGNQISYLYNQSGNSFNISKIYYSGKNSDGVSIEFGYQDRQDPVFIYKGGKKVSQSHILNKITIKLDANILWAYINA